VGAFLQEWQMGVHLGVEKDQDQQVVIAGLTLGQGAAQGVEEVAVGVVRGRTIAEDTDLAPGPGVEGAIREARCPTAAGMAATGLVLTQIKLEVKDQEVLTLDHPVFCRTIHNPTNAWEFLDLVFELQKET